MSNYRTSKVGEAYYDTLTVFDFDLISTVPGQVQSDFTVSFYRDGNSVPAPAHTITEIGSSGVYALEVPGGFSSTGVWAISAFVEYNGSTWGSSVEVRTHDIDDVYDVIVAGGSGMEPVTVTVLDSANANVPVPDLLINVYDDTGTALITYGRTDSSGQLDLLLDADTYILRMFKPGVASDEETILVPAGGDSFTIYVASIIVAPPPLPTLCRLYANFLSQEGLPFEKFKLQVHNLFDPNSSSGLAVVDSVRAHETDSNGHVEFDVVRGARVKVVFITTPMSREFLVPDAPTANLLTLFGSATDAFRVVKK